VQVRDRSADGKFVLIATGITLIIVYGSLYPFNFRVIADSNGPFRTLIKTWAGPFSRGDVVATVLLYLPYGFFWIQALRRWPPITRIGYVVFSALALSTGMELLQYYEPGRVSGLSDVYSDTIGAAVGAAAGLILFGRPFPWRAGRVERRPFIVLLISCWLGYRLFPYVPVIDLHKYWDAVKPLVFSPVLPPLDLYRHTVIWLAVALLIEALFGNARSRVVLLILVPVVLFARVLIIDAVLSPAEVAGGALATLVWWFFSRLQSRALIVAVLFAGVVVIEALEPFQFSAVTHPFGWIPFAGFMRGSMEVNVRSFFQKVFTYGTLTWLIVRAGYKFAIAAGLSCGLVLSLRLTQVFLPGRSAEITDPIMLLMVAGVMQAMGEKPTRFEAVQSRVKW
jgi:VanZ family protein